MKFKLRKRTRRWRNIIILITITTIIITIITTTTTTIGDMGLPSTVGLLSMLRPATEA